MLCLCLNIDERQKGMTSSNMLAIEVYLVQYASRGELSNVEAARSGNGLHVSPLMHSDRHPAKNIRSPM
jgi:hypothetical protein